MPVKAFFGWPTAACPMLIRPQNRDSEGRRCRVGKLQVGMSKTQGGFQSRIRTSCGEHTYSLQTVRWDASKNNIYLPRKAQLVCPWIEGVYHTQTPCVSQIQLASTCLMVTSADSYMQGNSLCLLPPLGSRSHPEFGVA